MPFDDDDFDLSISPGDHATGNTPKGQEQRRALPAVSMFRAEGESGSGTATPAALAALRTPAQAAPPAPALPAAGEALTLTPSAPKPSRAAQRAAQAYVAALEGGGAAAVVAPALPYDLPPAVDEADLASLTAVADELHLASPELGDVWVVKAYSDSPRTELTFRDLATLRTLVQVLPGARIVGLSRPSKGDGDVFPPPPPALPPVAAGAALDLDLDLDLSPPPPIPAAKPPSTGGLDLDLTSSPPTPAAKPPSTGGLDLDLDLSPPPPIPAAKPPSTGAGLLFAMCWGCDRVAVPAQGDLCPRCAS